jgi:hypothetical protein
LGGSAERSLRESLGGLTGVGTLHLRTIDGPFGQPLPGLRFIYEQFLTTVEVDTQIVDDHVARFGHD